MHITLQVDKHRLAGSDVALQGNARAFQSDRFTGQHARAIGPLAHAQRADAKWVAEGQHTVPGNQGDDGIRSLDAFVHSRHRAKQMCRQQRGHPAGSAVHLMSQHIQQNFGITLGIDMPVIRIEQLVLERLGIGEITVMHQHDAKGRVHIERLRLFLAEGIARCGVTHLPQAAIAQQAAHIARAKHILHHALGLVHEELAILLRNNACSILPAMLKQQQGVVNQLIDRRMTHHAHDSTHSLLPG